MTRKNCGILSGWFLSCPLANTQIYCPSEDPGITPQGLTVPNTASMEQPPLLVLSPLCQVPMNKLPLSLVFPPILSSIFLPLVEASRRKRRLHVSISIWMDILDGLLPRILMTLSQA